MGFISFVKKFFGAKEIVTEIKPQLEEVKPTILNPTEEPKILPSHETLYIQHSDTVNNQITDSVTVTKDNPKKEVTKKRKYYKPKKKVTTKPANKKRATK
jgi:hypothetical protein